MHSRSAAVFWTILLTLCISHGLLAEPLAKEEIDRFVSPLVDADYCVGLVVGVVDDGGTRVYGYGHKSSKDDTPPDGKTVFEIGSATKAFTGVLLADMVRRGEVAFDDPVQKYLPEWTNVPQVDGTVITLAHLASHTSGLPRMPTNFAPKDACNPYADYSVERMYAFLAECEPTRPAGESVEYSNLGMGLLGHALGRRAGKSYEQLVTERICSPLKMNETRMALTDGMKPRLAAGHDADGNAAANWDIPTFAGAGALRSTGDDMLKFLAANLRPDGAGELAEPIRDSQSPRTGADAANDIGLGWHVRRKPKLVWHNGQTGGYHSMVAFSPEKKVGVLLLANSATMQVDAHALALLRRLMGDKVEPPKVRTPVKVGPEVLEAYVGQYPLSPVFILTVTREGDRLFCQATGQAKFRIFPASETEFFYRVVEARIVFERGEDGAVKGLVLHQNGAKMPGPKRK